MRKFRFFLMSAARFVRCSLGHIFYKQVYDNFVKESIYSWKQIGFATLCTAGTGGFLYSSFFRTRRKEITREQSDKNSIVMCSSFVGFSVLVYSMWKCAIYKRSPAALQFMIKNFSVGPASSLSSVYLHTISHQGIIHLSTNAFVGCISMNTLTLAMYPSEIVALFLCSSSCGAMLQMLTNKRSTSMHFLGASAGIFGLLSMAVFIDTSAEYAMIFLPEFAFYGWKFILCLTAVDGIGMISRWKSGIAHGCHFGGYLVGIFFAVLLVGLPPEIKKFIQN